ncbi:MAG: hypothetical protein GF419_04645 [Ignavibacteriales bacterium]|nr:hypothetical protein [Ignavibacteriales bacterium]
MISPRDNSALLTPPETKGESEQGRLEKRPKKKWRKPELAKLEAEAAEGIGIQPGDDGITFPYSV